MMNTPLTPLLPNEDVDFECGLTLKGKRARRFWQECVARQMQPDDLMMKLVGTLIKDDLFAAILDTD
jgi:hypothetical protein